MAEQVRRHRPGCDIVSLRDWRGGELRTARDDLILAAAIQELRTFVTYDRRTVAPLAKEWSERRRSHAGIILIDDRTVAQNDLGGLVRALLQLWDEFGDLEWQDFVMYLPPA